MGAYRNGVGSITALTIVQTALLHAQNSTSDADSAVLTATATLALTTGLGTAPE